MKKILSLLVSALSVFGLGINMSAASVPQHNNINSIKETTPLYLETSASMQQHGGQTLLADHESHYSHSSHESHYSHRSHYSGY